MIFVDPHLLTKKIPISLKEFGVHGYIRFPKLTISQVNEDVSDAELQQPIGKEKLGQIFYSEQWGGIQIDEERGNCPYIVNLKGFCIEIHSEEFLDNERIHQIKDFLIKATSKLIGVLAIKDKCVSDTHDNIRPLFLDYSDFSYENTDGNIFVSYGKPQMFGPFGLTTVNHHLLFSLLRKIGNELTLQYELLCELFDFLNHGDYRSCVLHASTIFETTLLAIVLDYLKSKCVPEGIREIVVGKLRGFASYDSFYKKRIIKKCVIPEVKSTSELRNKVIHEGKKVTREEADLAYKAACEFLEFYSWPIFQD